MRAAILSITFAVVLAILYVRYLIVFRGFLPGYRGAVGFKNRGRVALASVRVVGFRAPVETRSLMPGEHSFSFTTRYALPEEVEISWRGTTDSETRQTRIPLAGVPRKLKDGEIFFVFTDTGTWAIEWSPELRLGELAS